jgi:hypothetical protein
MIKPHQQACRKAIMSHKDLLIAQNQLQQSYPNSMNKHLSISFYFLQVDWQAGQKIQILL